MLPRGLNDLRDDEDMMSEFEYGVSEVFGVKLLGWIAGMTWRTG